MTQLLVPKSLLVWKKLGGWGCGSEQAPLTIHTILAVDPTLEEGGMYPFFASEWPQKEPMPCEQNMNDGVIISIHSLDECSYFLNSV